MSCVNKNDRTIKKIEFLSGDSDKYNNINNLCVKVQKCL